MRILCTLLMKKNELSFDNMFDKVLTILKETKKNNYIFTRCFPLLYLLC